MIALRQLVFAVLGATAAIAMTGCSTTSQVTELANKPETGTAVNGLPFRAKQRYKVTLYRLEDNKYAEVEQKQHYANLADLNKLYVLKLDGSMLSDGTLNFKINPDNTLLNVKVASTGKAPEAITSVGMVHKDFADASTQRAADASSELNANEASIVKQEDAAVAALDAKNAAELAEAELASLPPSATLVERTTAAQKVARAKVLANQKARRGGLAQPY